MRVEEGCASVGPSGFYMKIQEVTSRQDLEALNLAETCTVDNVVAFLPMIYISSLSYFIGDSH